MNQPLSGSGIWDRDIGHRPYDDIINDLDSETALNRAGLLEHQTCPLSKLASLKLLEDPDKPVRVRVREEIKSYLLSGTPHPENVGIDLDCFWPIDDEEADEAVFV
ncbi:hypothetical protein Tsubulata_025800 [Turnera subulata]|uniref:Uncharacterized protein n=1 Tax=Turnera subulata TaxID=218843 RepID=A0A9Q0FTG6_9ROSI|nr:hypothetical protein Tsubulata_025800 [Turnera subulata]